MPPKSDLVEIGGMCFLGSASILFDTAVYGTHWIGPGIWLGLFYEYGKDSFAGFGKGWVPGIEGWWDPHRINYWVFLVAYHHWRKDLHTWTSDILLLLSIDWATLNMGRCIKGYSDVLSLDIVPSEFYTRHELPALLGTPSVDEHMEKKLPNVQDAVWCVVHFLYGWLFDWGLCGLCCSSNGCEWIWT
jgi:hypothetical protein